MRERLPARGSRVGSCVCPTGVAVAMFGVMFGLISCQAPGPSTGGSSRESSTSAPAPKIAEPSEARAALEGDDPLAAERALVPSESIGSAGDATTAALARGSELDSETANADRAAPAVEKAELEKPVDEAAANPAVAATGALASDADDGRVMRAIPTAASAVASAEPKPSERIEGAASAGIEKAQEPAEETLEPVSGDASSRTRDDADDDIVAGFQATSERAAAIAETAAGAAANDVPRSTEAPLVADEAVASEGSAASSDGGLVDDIVAFLTKGDDASAPSEATAMDPASSAVSSKATGEGSASASEVREVDAPAQVELDASVNVAAPAAGSAVEESPGAGIARSASDARDESSDVVHASATPAVAEAGIAPAVAASASSVGRASNGSSAATSQTKSGSSLRAEAESLDPGAQETSAPTDPLSLMPPDKADDGSPLRWLWWVAAAAVFAGIVYLGQRSRRSDALADDRF